MYFIGMIVAILVATMSSFAKRAPPPKVETVKNNGIEYSFRIASTRCENSDKSCGMQVSLVAAHSPSSDPLWETALYERIYNPRLETDVQTTYPSSLKWEKGDKLVAVDERGSRYVVNAKTGTLIHPLKTIVYKAQPAPSK